MYIYYTTNCPGSQTRRFVHYHNTSEQIHRQKTAAEPPETPSRAHGKPRRLFCCFPPPGPAETAHKKSNFFRSSFFSRVFVCLHKTTTQKPGTNPAAPVRRAAAKRARKARERGERAAPPPSPAPRPILPPQNFRAKAGRRNRCKAGANQRQRQQRKAGEPERNAGRPARIVPEPPATPTNNRNAPARNHAGYIGPGKRRAPATKPKPERRGQSRAHTHARVFIYISRPLVLCVPVYISAYISAAHCCR